MPSAPRSLPPLAIALAIFLCCSWGFNQVAIKLALPEIPGLIQASIRSGLAALAVWVWTWFRGVPLMRADRTLWPGLAAGALFAVEFLLIYEGLGYTAASRASVFLYTAPFFVVLGARWLLPAERFDAWQWLGLALSFLGLLIALGVPTPGAGEREFLGDLMLLAAGAGWGATTLIVKASPLARAPSEKVLLYQLVVSAPMLALCAGLFGERVVATPSLFAVSLLLYQSIWVVAFTFAAWFALIQRYSASQLSVFTFLSPMFGVLAGYAILSEPLTPAFAAAAALVLAGIVIVNRPR
jgi:drug/metabolite transporter (DMT)-like permease